MREFNDILRALIDLVPSRRKEALMELETEADAADLNRFVARAANLQASVCIELCQILSATSSKILVRLLGLYANRSESDLRLKAIHSLKHVSPEIRMDAVIELLQSTFFEIRISACEMLGNSASPAPNSALLKTLEDENVQVLLSNLEAIRKLRFSSAIEKITTLLQHEDKNVKIKAIEVMVDIDKENDFPVEEIVELLKTSNDTKVKETCCWAFGKKPSEKARNALLEILKNDNNIGIINAAASALSSYHDISTVKTLLERESSSSFSPTISLNCRRALNKMPENILISSAEEMLKNNDDLIRMEIAAILGELSFEGGKNILLKHLETEKETIVKSSILEALGHGGWLDTWDIIKSYIGDDSLISYSAVTALADMLDHEHIIEFATIFKHDIDATIQEAILKRLYMYGLANEIPRSINNIIQPLFFSNILNISMISISIAGRIKDPNFIEDIFKVMSETNVKEIKETCCKSLQDISDNSLSVLLEHNSDKYLKTFCFVIEQVGAIDKKDLSIIPKLAEKAKNNIDGAQECLYALAEISPTSLIKNTRKLGDNPANYYLVKTWNKLPEEIKKEHVMEFSKLLDSSYDDIRLAVIEALPDAEEENLLGKVVDIALSDNNEMVREAARVRAKIFVENALK